MDILRKDELSLHLTHEEKQQLKSINTTILQYKKDDEYQLTDEEKKILNTIKLSSTYFTTKEDLN